MKLNIKNKKVFISLIAFLIVMEGMFLYLSYRAFNSKNKDITLDEVMVLNDGGIELKKGSFAILKETGLGTGEYVEHESDTWPTCDFDTTYTTVVVIMIAIDNVIIAIHMIFSPLFIIFTPFFFL